MAEWSIAPVLKTGNGKPFVSSNLTASANMYQLESDSQFDRMKILRVRQHRRHVCTRNPQPSSHCHGQLIHASGRNESSLSHIVNTIVGKRWCSANELGCCGWTPKREMMRTPTVICTVAIGGECSAKIGGRETEDVLQEVHVDEG